MPIDKMALLQRAKEYMEILATGTDPISGRPLSRDDPMGNERLWRCFSFVAGVLEEVIAAGGTPHVNSGSVPGENPHTRIHKRKTSEQEFVETEDGPLPKKEKKPKEKKPRVPPFTITEEQLAAVQVIEKEISTTEMTRRLNKAAGLEKCEMNARFLNNALTELGFLTFESEENNKRAPTPAGEELGITRKLFYSVDGRPYYVNMLNVGAQQFILDNLDGILDSGRRGQETYRIRAKQIRKAAQENLQTSDEETE